MNVFALPLFAALAIFAIPLPGQDKQGREPIQPASAKKAPSARDLARSAMHDYVEGIYDVTPDRIARTVARDLDKVGIVEKDGKLMQPTMSYEALHRLAGTYNKDGKKIPKDAPKKVEVLGVLPHVAIAKLTAAWGIDYIQMSRTKTGWRIEQITWQRAEKPLADAATTHAAVKAAALGYANAFYNVDPKLIDKFVHPKLAKYGNYHGEWSKMNFTQLKSLAATAFKGRPAPKDAPRDVEILDCADNTAAVKLTGAWGIDFMNLIRTEDGWKIRQVIWQSHPPKEKKAK